jgi:peroxiredoxin
LVLEAAAYTRTCSSRHLPGYVSNSEALKAKGIDEIAGVPVKRRVRDGRLGGRSTARPAR